ncbi:hypothetical protein LJY25_05495 [Hymenobacter sp. BT175]|uniref:hypothetical protein n=1 Tax=Hymenobacter translucens TaxID=2886507 RepID=UPI001D0DF423|nr:hypothetical protein [Hymenobacter translucens]MCC2545890.1 hypothetical protein [Hymenobacter translucens]
MAEEYADKMARKTDAELREYISGRAQYREDAVLAAFDELARRGQPHPDEAALRPELEQVVQEQQKQAVAARQLAERETEAEPEANLPALYSKGTIAMFSMLPMSMMIGGGVLLGMNLFRLGRKWALLGLVGFVIGYVLLGGQVLNWAILQQGLDPFVGTLLFNVPATLIYIFWFWPRYVQATAFRSRGIMLPIVICFLIVWGLQKAMPYLIKQQPKEVRDKVEQLMKRQQ